MKFTLKTTVVLATLLSPLFQGVTGQNNTVNFFNVAASAGAAYFMSNDPSGNYLFAASIGQDAQLTLAKGYYTGGNGGKGMGPPGDPLFSQGSIIVSKKSNVVILVNPGSDSLTAFRINTTEPTNLSMIGSPVYSGGEFPVSVAMNDAGNLVCALNGGAINGISCFHFDQKNGLTPLDNTTRYLKLNQTTPPSGPDNTVGQLLFGSNDTKLIAAVKGILGNSSHPGYLATWDVNCDGSVSQDFTRVIGGMRPLAIIEIPGMDAILAADPGNTAGGYDIFDLAAATRNPTLRAQSVLIPGAIGVCWTDYSHDSGNFYLDDFATSHIYELNINKNLQGTLVKSYELDQYDGPLDFEISHVLGKDRLYILAGNNTALETLDVNAPGQLKRTQKLDIGTPITQAGLPLNQYNVFGLATYIV